jgi:hypothetical protein
MIVSIRRYFRLRTLARRLGLHHRFWWTNSRLLAELFEERCRRQIIVAFEKRPKILDFRSYDAK